MSKLFKLKQWLSISDAAKYLSTILEEEVRDVDILRLGIDMKLTLSVVFPEAPYGVLFEPVADEDLEYVEMPALTGDVNIRVLTKSARLAPGGGWLQIQEKKRFSLEDDWPYDLAMIGGEYEDVQRRFWQLAGWEREETTNTDGTFVSDAGKYIRIEGRLPSKAGEVSFYPLGGLPENAQLVVRTQALNKLLALLGDPPNDETEKPLISRERTNLLNIIGALLEQAGIKEAALIAAMTERHPSAPGIKKRTLEEKFAEAKRSLNSN